jgi:predicted nucleotidyltransferase
MGIAERWKRVSELPPDIGEAVERLIPLFRSEGVLLAYLFGSLSKGQVAQDVDLAILSRDRPAFRLREAITECLGTERVDLVDLRRASPVLRYEIIRGRLLYAADEETQERFELATVRLYRDTAPLRRQQREYLRRRMAQWSSDGKP